MGAYCLKPEKEQGSINSNCVNTGSNKNNLSIAPIIPQAIPKKEIPNSDSSFQDYKSNSIEHKKNSILGNYDESLAKNLSQVNFSNEIIINEEKLCDNCKQIFKENLNLSYSQNAKNSKHNYEEIEKYKKENSDLKADIKALTKKCFAAYEECEKIKENNEIYIKQIQKLNSQSKNYKEQPKNKFKQESVLITCQSTIISIKSSLKYEKLIKEKKEIEDQFFVLKSTLEKQSKDYEEVSKKLIDSESELVKLTEKKKKLPKESLETLKNKEKTDQDFKLLQDKLFAIENDLKKEVDEKTQMSKTLTEHEKKRKNAVEENKNLLTIVQSLEVVYM